MPIDSFVHRHVHSEPFHLRELCFRSLTGYWPGYPQHQHDCHQCYLSVEGELELVLDDRVVVVEPGQIAVVQPGVIRSVHSLADRQQLTYGFALLQDFGLGLHRLGTATYNCSQHRVLATMSREMQQVEDALASWNCRALLTEILIELCRQQEAPPADKAFARQVDQLLWTKMRRAPPRSEIAQGMHCSESQLARRFRAATGKSILQRMKELRFQRAETLLLHSDLSIQQIGREIGLRCHGRFAVWFKQCTGHSPSAWRQAASQQPA